MKKDLTLDDFLRFGVTRVSAAAMRWIRSVLQVPSDMSEVRHKAAKTLAAANLTPEVRRAIAEIISFVACQSVDALGLIEGHDDVVRLVDKKGEPLWDERGYNAAWIEIWLEKFGSLEGLADAASKGKA